MYSWAELCQKNVSWMERGQLFVQEYAHKQTLVNLVKVNIKIDLIYFIEESVHVRMKIVLSFTPTHVVPDVLL